MQKIIKKFCKNNETLLYIFLLIFLPSTPPGPDQETTWFCVFKSFFIFMNMVLGFNLYLFISVFLVPMLYAIIIYFTSPYKSVSFRRGMLYLFGGIMSTVIVQFIYFFFPSMVSAFIGADDFHKYFFVVGPIEEFSKYIMFLFILYMTKDRKISSHPFKYMFYMSMVGLGFAVLENMHYITRYGEEVIATRLFTSTIAHMIFGLLFGYWLGLAHIEKKKLKDRSVFGVLTESNKRLKKMVLTFVGFFVASFYHGLYNFNLAQSMFSTMVILIIILMFGFIFTRLLASDLNNQWRNRNTKKDNPPTELPSV